MSDDDRPSISELQREIARWPTNWKPVLGEEGEWTGSWSTRSVDEFDDTVSADADEDYANDFARLVALSRNAIPVLLEVVAAVLEYRRWAMTREQIDSSCGQALDRALAKVRP